MKKILLVISMFVALGFTSCGDKKKEVKQWEYFTMVVWGEIYGSYYLPDFEQRKFPDPTDSLNKLGEEGWEMVSVYTRVETVHPNFGDKKYVAGLQPNTRTAAVYYVFKRPKQEKEVKAIVENDIEVVDTVEVVDTLYADDII